MNQQTVTPANRPPVPPHLQRIALSVGRGDYTVLRGGGEEQVRAYAKTLGLSPAELLRRWAGSPSPASSLSGRRTRVVVEIDDDEPPERDDDDNPEDDDDDDEPDDARRECRDDDEQDDGTDDDDERARGNVEDD